MSQARRKPGWRRAKASTSIGDAQARRYKVQRAIELLRAARAQLLDAGAPKTAARVRAALSSALGAERAANGRETRLILAESDARRASAQGGA